ncbi:MAG: hypothetical protein COV46_06725 [Deltaproteobacteria bacterium CG11_big_fil_rev_8_21_14_0_20_49_13]|nr:MAG: hypothetical protein COV46_06725 [Deltaproteobacteria bacterium CG11_big_fil_rev_8_21_14_0_20_49_13]
MRLCHAILNDTVNSENFGNMLVEAGVRLEEKEWDVPNKLLEKSEEIKNAVGGKDRKTVH